MIVCIGLVPDWSEQLFAGFTPFNRTFIAMNQSSMAALTTSCILITFDGKVTNQTCQKEKRLRCRASSFSLPKTGPLEWNKDAKVFHSLCHFGGLWFCFVETVSWTKTVWQSECVLPFSGKKRDWMQTIHKFCFYFSGFWYIWCVCVCIWFASVCRHRRVVVSVCVAFFFILYLFWLPALLLLWLFVFIYSV